MGFGWVFLLIGVLWLVQLVLAYLQARRFMARARALRGLGRVSIGASPRQIRGRAYVNGEATLILNPEDPFCWGIR